MGEPGESDSAQSRRELGKEARRQRILDTAEALIRARGDTSFSMRELADEAGVAFATPFNLFDSKENLLATLLHRRVWPRQRQMAERDVTDDPVTHILEFAASALQTYTHDENLFRPLLRTVLSPDVESVGPTFDAAIDFWRPCVAPAVEEGAVRSVDGGRFLVRALHIVFRGVLVGWAGDSVAADVSSRDLTYAVAAVLGGVIDDRGRPAIDGRLRALEDGGDVPQ